LVATTGTGFGDSTTTGAGTGAGTGTGAALTTLGVGAGFSALVARTGAGFGVGFVFSTGALALAAFFGGSGFINFDSKSAKENNGVFDCLVAKGATTWARFATGTNAVVEATNESTAIVENLIVKVSKTVKANDYRYNKP
jgi:hypothetical protein